jgi:hypothetical protein
MSSKPANSVRADIVASTDPAIGNPFSEIYAPGASGMQSSGA